MNNTPHGASPASSSSHRLDEHILPDLLRRVKEATGGDRELDHAIARQFGWIEEIESEGGRVWTEWRRPEGFHLPLGTMANPPFFTHSTDAALGLCERVLPLATGKTGEWIWSLRHQAMGGHLATVAQLGEASPYGICEQAEHASPALALLAAALQALISNTQDDGEHT